MDENIRPAPTGAWDDIKLPDPVKSVIFVSGSWYDMGRQFAQQAPYGVRVKLDAGIANAVRKFGTKARALACLDAYVSVVKERIPLMLALWRGIADGAQAEYNDVLLAFMDYNDGDERCSNVSAWGSATKSGSLLCGLNCDEGDIVNYYMPTIVAYPENGHAFISASAFTCNCTMNDAGLVSMGSGGEPFGPGDNTIGLPNALAMLKCAADCGTAAEAERMFLTERIGSSSGENDHFADIGGGACIIEHTSAHDGVRRSGDFGEKDYILATNTYLTKQMQSSCPQGELAYTRDNNMVRYWSEERVLLENHGRNTLDTINAALANKGYYVQATCDYKEWVTHAPGYQIGWTRDAWAQPRALAVHTGQWTPEKRCARLSCVFSVLMEPARGDFYITNGCRDTLVSRNPGATGKFCRIRLCKTPRESVELAHTDARRVIFNAAIDIEYSDGATEANLRNLDAAKGAYLQGVQLMNMAMCELDAEKQQALWGRSMSAFWRVQCLGALARVHPQPIGWEGE